MTRSEDALKRELESLRTEHRRILESTSYQLGRLLTTAIRSPQALLRLPLDIYRLARKRSSQRNPAKDDSAAFIETRNNWHRLANHIAAQPDQKVVFLLSGTTYMHNFRGNRPIRQTHALLETGASVLFSYHRGRSDEPLPSFDAPRLVQSPIDVTLQLLDEIAATELGDARKLFIISYPYPGIERSIEVFREQGWAVIYDCRDDWEEFAKVGMARWFDARIERFVVENVDRTLCVSRPLVEKMQRLDPAAHISLMPNAVESGFLPDGYQRVPDSSPKKIGYFGHLSPAWFDWEALVQIARARPKLHFEIIGHSAPSLALPGNIELLGPVPWTELHHHAARWSAAIIPFRMGPLADGVDPIKIYEYLAFGHPVVSFRMPQIADYPYTTTVSTVVEFCVALDDACQTTPDRDVIDHFLRNNTWEMRALELLAIADAKSTSPR